MVVAREGLSKPLSTPFRFIRFIMDQPPMERPIVNSGIGLGGANGRRSSPRGRALPSVAPHPDFPTPPAVSRRPRVLSTHVSYYNTSAQIRRREGDLFHEETTRNEGRAHVSEHVEDQQRAAPPEGCLCRAHQVGGAGRSWAEICDLFLLYLLYSWHSTARQAAYDTLPNGVSSPLVSSPSPPLHPRYLATKVSFHFKMTRPLTQLSNHATEGRVSACRASSKRQKGPPPRLVGSIKSSSRA